MNIPIPLARLLARFDALSTRERALVGGAALIGTVLLWFAAFYDPAAARQRLLSAELTTLQQSIYLTTQSIQETNEADPILTAQREETKLKEQLAAINTQLAAKSAGLIPPERMVQVIHDVLALTAPSSFVCGCARSSTMSRRLKASYGVTWAPSG